MDIAGNVTDDMNKVKNKFANAAHDQWKKFPRWLQYCLAVGGAILGLVELFAGYRYWRASVILISALTCAVFPFMCFSTGRSPKAIPTGCGTCIQVQVVPRSLVVSSLESS